MKKQGVIGLIAILTLFLAIIYVIYGTLSLDTSSFIIAIIFGTISMVSFKFVKIKKETITK